MLWCLDRPSPAPAMYLLLLLVVVGVLTRPTEGSFRRHVLQQVLEDVGEERRRRTREFRRQGLVEGATAAAGCGARDLQARQ